MDLVHMEHDLIVAKYKHRFIFDRSEKEGLIQYPTGRYRISNMCDKTESKLEDLKISTSKKPEDLNIPELKNLCDILGVQVAESKTQIVQRIGEIDAEKLTVLKLEKVLELAKLSKSGLKKELVIRFKDWISSSLIVGNFTTISIIPWEIYELIARWHYGIFRVLKCTCKKLSRMNPD